MPLPAYLLAQPSTNPTDVVRRQIQNMGVDAEIERSGSTITVRDFDVAPNEQDLAERAIRLLINHADANTLSIDAVVLPVHGNIIRQYQAAGFTIHVDASNDDEGAHTLLRRCANN